MDAFPMIFGVFLESAKVRFDSAGASGLRFSPLIFWLCASFLFALIFCVFWIPWGAQIHAFKLGRRERRDPLNHV